MSRELVTLSVGQCGNQIGDGFWDQLCLEHGIEPDGSLRPLPAGVDSNHDRKNTFFYEATSRNGIRYVPRALLLDLEPRVINAIRTARPGRFNPDNIYSQVNGAGAGNIWSSGYDHGDGNAERLIELLDREVESSESLEGFMVMHSVGGGTGSGLGSFMLEQIREHYPKKLIQTHSVFPGAMESAVVLHPYNCLLTLQRLAQHADAVMVLDNSALHSIACQQFNKPETSLAETNQLVSTVMAASTAPIRFPGYLHSDLSSLLAAVVPNPDCHFLMPAYSPFSFDGTRVERRHGVLDVLRNLLKTKTRLVYTSTPESSRYIAILDVLQNCPDPREVSSALVRIREHALVHFVDGAPSTVQVNLLRSSRYLDNNHHVSGLMLANHTCVAGYLNHIVKDYDKLSARGAYLNNYKKYDSFGEDWFKEAREVASQVIERYKALEKRS